MLNPTRLLQCLFVTPCLALVTTGCAQWNPVDVVFQSLEPQDGYYDCENLVGIDTLGEAETILADSRGREHNIFRHCLDGYFYPQNCRGRGTLVFSTLGRDLMEMDLETHQVEELFTDVRISVDQFLCAPEGETLLVAEWDDVWITDKDGTNLHRLELDFMEQFSFSSDGAQLLLSSVEAGTYLYDVTTEELSLWSETAHGAHFSQDDQSVVYLTREGEERVDVMVSRADGSEARKLTDLPPNWHLSPLRFTPDGTQLLFVEHYGHPWDRRDIDSALYSIDVATGSPRLVTAEDRHVTSFDIDSDGEQLVVGLDGNIVLMDLDGTGEILLTDSDRLDRTPIFLSIH